MRLLTSLWVLPLLFAACAAPRVAVVPSTEPTPPPAAPPSSLSVSALPTGSMTSRAAFSFAGGSLSEERTFSMTALLIQHPKGTYLIDTGFGAHLQDHVARAVPALMRGASSIKGGVPVAEQLKAGGIDPTGLAGVILTHAHWDHVSGLDSLTGVPVLVNAAEQAYIQSGNEGASLARYLAPTLQPYTFDGPAYLGFPASFDLFGDGSVVLVPAPGHTPGSVLVFISLPSGKRLLLLGDLVWQQDGIELPAPRPKAIQKLVDVDPPAVDRAIGLVAGLKQRFPELVLLPAHESRAFQQLPVFPATLH